jgi:hypothetical protein
MRKHPRVANRPSVEQCLCSPTMGFKCSLHRAESAKPGETDSKLAEPDRFSLTRPWNPDALPDNLRGYGHHTHDSLNPDGEWILPEEDKDGEFMRAVAELFLN